MHSVFLAARSCVFCPFDTHYRWLRTLDAHFHGSFANRSLAPLCLVTVWKPLIVYCDWYSDCSFLVLLKLALPCLISLLIDSRFSLSDLKEVYGAHASCLSTLTWQHVLPTHGCRSIAHRHSRIGQLASGSSSWMLVVTSWEAGCALWGSPLGWQKSLCIGPHFWGQLDSLHTRVERAGPDRTGHTDDTVPKLPPVAEGEVNVQDILLRWKCSLLYAS